MHELSIALNIVEIIQQEAVVHKANSILELEIEIGELAGVDIECLRFTMDSVIRNTILENCEIKYNTIHGLCKCIACNHEYDASTLFSCCPQCGSYASKNISGTELRIKSFTLN